MYSVGAQTWVPVLINIFTKCLVKKFKCICMYFSIAQAWGIYFTECLVKKAPVSRSSKLELDFLLSPSQHFSIAQVPVFFIESVKKFIKCIPVEPGMHTASALKPGTSILYIINTFTECSVKFLKIQMYMYTYIFAG